MSEPFLITGLPRSRTAWMAEIATDGDMACHHEPMTWLNRWDDIFTRIWGVADGPRYMGISDHLLGFYLPEIMARSMPRTLIIERPIGEVRVSLERLGQRAEPFCTMLLAALAYAHPLILRVAYGDLRDTATVARCLLHLAPEATPDRARIERFQTINIQADVSVAVRDRQRIAGREADFLPVDVLAEMRAA